LLNQGQDHPEELGGHAGLDESDDITRRRIRRGRIRSTNAASWTTKR
jgi:hypothetical protein